MTDHTPTLEQAAIIEAACKRSESIMIMADAGCAKSSTLEMLSKRMTPVPTLALAFNKKIATEMQARLPKHFVVKTMNGLGYGAWASKLGGAKLTLRDNKLGDLLKELCKEEAYDLTEDDWKDTLGLVRDARNAGLVHSAWTDGGLIPDTDESWDMLLDQTSPREDLTRLAREVLKRSTLLAFQGEVDFDDMIYMPVMFKGNWRPFPLVLVDEAQDLSPLNHMQVQFVSNKRLIVVGDPKQAIYAFRGADSSSMEKLRALRPAWLDLSLHTTFRCPKIIVARNRGHAPGFTAAEANPEGEFHDWKRPGDDAPLEFNGVKEDGWGVRWLRSLKLPGEKIFVLCRNNAPLLGLAFKLIRQGVMPQMLGRDIGKGLIGLSKKIAPKDATPRDEFLTRIESWRREETRKAREAKKAHLVSGITDRAECLIAVAEEATDGSAGGVRAAITALFKRDSGEFTLATGHGAKGLEAAVNVHLDPWRIPSRCALEDAEAGDERQLMQERNLKYVIETRTKRVFVEANLEDFV